MEIALLIALVMAGVSIPLGLYVRSRAIKELRSNLPASPLQVLDRRLAAGEISAEEYQYEKYLLENK